MNASCRWIDVGCYKETNEAVPLEIAHYNQIVLSTREIICTHVGQSKVVHAYREYVDMVKRVGEQSIYISHEGKYFSILQYQELPAANARVICT